MAIGKTCGRPRNSASLSGLAHRSVSPLVARKVIGIVWATPLGDVVGLGLLGLYGPPVGAPASAIMPLCGKAPSAASPLLCPSTATHSSQDSVVYSEGYPYLYSITPTYNLIRIG